MLFLVVNTLYKLFDTVYKFRTKRYLNYFTSCWHHQTLCCVATLHLYKYKHILYVYSICHTQARIAFIYIHTCMFISISNTSFFYTSVYISGFIHVLQDMLCHLPHYKNVNATLLAMTAKIYLLHPAHIAMNA